MSHITSGSGQASDQAICADGVDARLLSRTGHFEDTAMSGSDIPGVTRAEPSVNTASRPRASRLHYRSTGRSMSSLLTGFPSR
jgi:hypothetical protein